MWLNIRHQVIWAEAKQKDYVRRHMPDLAEQEPQEFHHGTALSNFIPRKKSCYLRS